MIVLAIYGRVTPDHRINIRTAAASLVAMAMRGHWFTIDEFLRVVHIDLEVMAIAPGLCDALRLSRSPRRINILANPARSYDLAWIDEMPNYDSAWVAMERGSEPFLIKGPIQHGPVRSRGKGKSNRRYD